MKDELQNSTRGFYVLMVDVTDNTTGLPGLSLSFELSKSGANYQSVTPTVDDKGGGVYWIVPDASHRNTLGEIAWRITADGAVTVDLFENIVAVDAQLVPPTNATVRTQVDESLVDHLQTQTPAKGNLSYLRTLELVAAATVGSAVLDSETGDETFSHLDGSDAFTSTVDVSGTRTVMVL